MSFSTFLLCLLATLPHPRLEADTHQQEGKIQAGQTLADLLSKFELDPAKIAEIAKLAKPVLDPRTIRSGQTWQAYLGQGDHKLRYFIYVESPYHSVVFDFGPRLRVYRVERPVSWEEGIAAGVIEKSVAHALEGGNHPQNLARALRSLFMGDISFSKLHKGDSFRVIYEGEQFDGKFFGRFTIKAASFVHRGKTYYRFAKDGEIFDEGGEGFEPLFLDAPILGGVVTSHYAGSRFHPVLKRHSPHLGTDYGAPEGTPILALADGVVTEVSRTRYNGNYVKIRHDKVYETQYLHMSRWAENLAEGQRIEKGTVIGYVGNTGLADGHHVCLRFWKNGRQVNFKKQKLPKSEKRTSPEELAEFHALRQRLDELSDES